MIFKRIQKKLLPLITVTSLFISAYTAPLKVMAEPDAVTVMNDIKVTQNPNIFEPAPPYDGMYYNLSGSCGDNVYYYYNYTEKRLVITGTGPTYDNEDLFRNLLSMLEINEVIVEEGVTRIGNGMFAGSSNLKSISLPDSLREIGYDAFIDSGLEEIQMNNGADLIYADNWLVSCNRYVSLVDISEETIGIADGVFSKCNYLSEIIIPEGVLYLGNDVFPSTVSKKNISSLKNVVYPDSLKYAGVNSFNVIPDKDEITIPAGVSYLAPGAVADPCYPNESCLRAINVSPNNTNFISFDGALFTTDMMTLVKYPNCKGEKPYSYSYEIPYGVTEIYGHAFSNLNSNITSVVIPPTVKNIGEYAFAYSTGLKKIELPYGITEISDYTFAGCSSIENIDIPDTVLKIGAYAFQTGRCRHFTVPSSVSYISDDSPFGVMPVLTVHNRSYALNYAISHNIDFMVINDAQKPIEGDMNQNSIYDISDVIIIQKYLIMSAQFTHEQIDSADINMDEKVDVFDLMRLKRKMSDQDKFAGIYSN